MAFKNLKVTIVTVEGNCSRSCIGTTFYVRDARLTIPAGHSVCLFALGSLLQPLTAAMMNTLEGESILNILEEWQCPDPLAHVIFRIEEVNKEE